ncbi:hypothetical protein E4U35_008331, partial [Claviceps purpurea]
MDLFQDVQFRGRYERLNLHDAVMRFTVVVAPMLWEFYRRDGQKVGGTGIQAK